MSTDITVSLDEFIVFNTPNHSCDNKHYIGSDRLKTLTYSFLIGNNKIYQRHRSYWLLKAVLVEDKLLVDYSFEDVDLLEEQILILSAFDRVVTIKWETLWEYFNVVDIEELNKISRQLVDRRLDEIANPLKFFYNNAVDDNKTQLDYEGWEVEMNELLTKWKECEQARLLASTNRYSTSEIDNYISSKDLQWFIREYYNNSIVFYTPPDVQPVVEEVLTTATVQPNAVYTEARDLLLEHSTMTSSDLNPNSAESLAEYIASLEEEVELPPSDILHYGTIVYNYNRGTVETPFMPVFEDLTDEVITEEELYQDALQAIADTSGLETDEFLPLSTTSLNDYLDWVRDITDLPEDGVVNYGTIVYNYHRIENEYVIVEDLADEVTEAGQIDHPF